MEFLHSLRLFTWGIVRRFYWMLPTLLVDPFDLLNTLFGVEYNPPTWIVWALFSFGLFLAASFSYHEIRMKGGAQAATLEFGEAELDDASEIVWWKHGARFSVPAHLWRVTLTNQRRDTVAKNVSVKVIDVHPRIGLRSFDVHETHNDEPPFRQLRNIRRREPIDFDIIGKQTNGDSVYLYRSDLAGDRFVYELSDREMESIRNALYSDGIVLEVEAFVDPPSSGAQASYRARVDASGHLQVTKV